MGEVVLADLRFHAEMRGCDAVRAAEEALACLLEDDGGLRGSASAAMGVTRPWSIAWTESTGACCWVLATSDTMTSA